jgi:hypothetical protein
MGLSRYERRGEENNLTTAGNRTPAVQPLDRSYPDSWSLMFISQFLISQIYVLIYTSCY